MTEPTTTRPIQTVAANLSIEQFTMLMEPLQGFRVKTRDGNSYLEAWDVKAHLTRVFGFGGWSFVTDEAQCIVERDVPGKQGKGDNHQVVWKVRGQLHIPQINCTYAEYATGAGSMPDWPKAHDTAIKSAESDALKRCAIALGTQFGLSLYNNGSLRNITSGILVRPYGVAVEAATHTVSQAPEDERVVGVLSDNAEQWLADLRSWAEEQNDVDRITGVKVLTDSAEGSGILEQVTAVAGSPVTLAKLAEDVAQGKYTPKPA